MEPNQPTTSATKYIIGIVVVALIIAGVSLSNKKSAPSTQTQTAETATPNNATVVTPADTSASKTVTVEYTDQGFTPKEISINAGDTVKFINKSTEGMWVGSAMHPSHVVYSGTTLREHCPDTAGTAFDQCGSGNEYSFTFAKVGSWGYHNHVDARMYGKVTVAAK